MKHKIKGVIQGVFFLLLIIVLCIAGISGLARGIVWTLMPITTPTCDGRVMTNEDECVVTHNGFDDTVSYTEQLSTQQGEQLADRILFGSVIVVIVGVPILLFFVSNRKKKSV